MLNYIAGALLKIACMTNEEIESYLGARGDISKALYLKLDEYYKAHGAMEELGHLLNGNNHNLVRGEKILIYL